ncbi:MAG: TRCF domain-containing protein, partial [Pseudomonadota bacterium]
TEMMGQAIAELRGEPPRPEFEPELKLAIPAYIPDSFVPDENERLVLYRRMARADSQATLDELRDEMRDRFGPIPTLIENLLRAMNVRRRMRELMIVSAATRGGQLEIRFHPEAPLEPQRLVALADSNRQRMRLTPSFQLIVKLAPGEYAEVFEQIDGVLQALKACERLENASDRSAGPLVN